MRYIKAVSSYLTACVKNQSGKKLILGVMKRECSKLRKDEPRLEIIKKAISMKNGK